jgi:large subunit ribosomal protein L4
MPQLEVKDSNGKTVGSLALPDEVFAVAVKRHLLHEAVRNYRAAAHRGTHDTKNRTEIAGGGKKPWKQKHTGRSRHGSSRSPLWRKGGTIQGPTPHEYAYSLPKQVRRSALRMALSLRAKGDKLIVVDTFDLPTPKSRELVALIEGKLGLSRKVLIVHDSAGGNLALAARNLENVKAVRALGINVYDILNHDYLVFSRGAAEKVGEVLAR